MPNLSGDVFAANWSGAPLTDLATELRQMPPGNTAGLDERAYEELAAYLLAFNGIPAAPDTAANTLRFGSDGALPDIRQGQQATIAVNIASGAAEVEERLTPVTDEMLISPPAEDWLLWQRSYDNQGYSSLDQINRETVSDLALSWRMPLQTGENNPGPTIHDGIIRVIASAWRRWSSVTPSYMALPPYV